MLIMFIKEKNLAYLFKLFVLYIIGFYAFF